MTKKVISEKRKLWMAGRKHLNWHDGCAHNTGNNRWRSNVWMVDCKKQMIDSLLFLLRMVRENEWDKQDTEVNIF